MINIPFNKPYNSGSELYNIAQSVVHGYTAGDGNFGKKCQRKLKSLLGEKSEILLTTSCTSALEMSAILLNIKEGDEVILPSYTFVSTANAFCLRGAKPVFVDIDPYTLNIDVNAVESAITSKTRAIVPVHYAGISCDMDKLMSVAARFNIPVVEDAAQAITSTYKGKALGTFGHFSTFSFHETKNIICGEGGALCVNEPSLVEKAEIIREKGTDRAKFFRGQVDKYTWREIGSSYVMSDILSAYLYAQLENIENIQKSRFNAYNIYSNKLNALEHEGILKLPHIPSYNEHNAHIFYLIVESTKVREKLINYLKQKGIMAVFHYVPLHTSPIGSNYGFKAGQLPITEDLSSRLVRLPLFAAESSDYAEIVSDAVLEFFGK